MASHVGLEIVKIMGRGASPVRYCERAWTPGLHGHPVRSMRLPSRHLLPKQNTLRL